MPRLTVIVARQFIRFVCGRCFYGDLEFMYKLTRDDISDNRRSASVLSGPNSVLVNVLLTGHVTGSKTE